MQLVTYFKNQTILFLDELIDQFPSEPELIYGRLYIETQVSAKDLIDQFIDNVLPHQEKISKRDEEVLHELKDTEYFSKLDSIWGNINDENRDVIWKWLNAFVLIANKYLKNKNH